LNRAATLEPNFSAAEPGREATVDAMRLSLDDMWLTSPRMFGLDVSPDR
jgi:hypothetical protein